MGFFEVGLHLLEFDLDERDVAEVLPGLVEAGVHLDLVEEHFEVVDLLEVEHLLVGQVHVLLLQVLDPLLLERYPL